MSEPILTIRAKRSGTEGPPIGAVPDEVLAQGGFGLASWQLRWN